MAPGSPTPYSSDVCMDMFLVIHETEEQTKVLGTYPSEEAFLVALQNQVGVFDCMKEKMLVQVLEHCADRSLEWKLKMLQEAMEAYFHDVGLEPLTDYFLVTNQQVSDSVANKRKMFADLRGASKLVKLNSSCGAASTIAVSSMSRYMYETLPFGSERLKRVLQVRQDGRLASGLHIRKAMKVCQMPMHEHQFKMWDNIVDVRVDDNLVIRIFKQTSFTDVCRTNSLQGKAQAN